MRYQPEYFEKIFSLRQPNEVVFLDSCLLIARDYNLDHVKTMSRVLSHNSNWFVTPSVRKEYKKGTSGLKKISRYAVKSHIHGSKNHVPLKETGCSKELVQAREGLLSTISKEIHDPFNERNLAPKTLDNYNLLLPKVQELFQSYNDGEIHQTDVDLVSICLAHALDGRRVILASNDRVLTQTFCEGTRNVSWRIQNGRGPKIPVYESEARFFDYAHMSYFQH